MYIYLCQCFSESLNSKGHHHVIFDFIKLKIIKIFGIVLKERANVNSSVAKLQGFNCTWIKYYYVTMMAWCWWGNTAVLGKKLSLFSFSVTNHTWPDRGQNSGGSSGIFTYQNASILNMGISCWIRAHTNTQSPSIKFHKYNTFFGNLINMTRPK